MAGAGYKSFTAGSILTATEVNTYLMEQSTMVFATTTARDAAITSPAKGMMCYISSNDASEGLYTYNGTSWREGPGWNAPWGVVQYNQKTSGTQSITTETTLTSLTASTTLIDNRLYRLTLFCQFSNTTASAVNLFSIRVGGTAVLNSQHIAGNTVNAFGVVLTGYYEALSTGAVTIDARGKADSGTLVVASSSTGPSQLLVEDIGPAGAPV